jgi:NADPH-ferrihemoprotein reductase
VERNTLEQLIPYASDPRERARLEHLVSPAGMPAFDAWATRAQRSVAEALEEFASVKLDLAALLQVLPRLQARAYTIASSAVVNPGVASIVASVIDAPKPDGGEGGGSAASASSSARRLRGVCTNDLLRTGVGKDLLVYVKESTFRLPADPRVPILLIGPGTGIAPMMAFLQERRHQKKANHSSSVGDTVLFFGCRRAEEDFIYERELKGYVADRTLTGLHIAFSREGPQKVYVQDLLRQEGQGVWRSLSGGGSDEGGRPAHVYVCGATRMGHDVMAALEAVSPFFSCVEWREEEEECVAPAPSPSPLHFPFFFFPQIVAEHGKMSAAEASKYVKRMQEEHRYVQELWSS